MKQLKKGSAFLSSDKLKTEKREMHEMLFIKEGIHPLFDVVRKGAYSSVGYITMKGPITQAERDNMPFMDPEFEYDSPNN